MILIRDWEINVESFRNLGETWKGSKKELEGLIGNL